MPNEEEVGKLPDRVGGATSNLNKSDELLEFLACKVHPKFGILLRKFENFAFYQGKFWSFFEEFALYESKVM